MIYKIPTFQTCKCANAVPIPPARQSFQDKRRNQVNTGLNFSRNNVILIATRTLVRASISPFMPPFNIPMCMWLKVLSRLVHTVEYEDDSQCASLTETWVEVLLHDWNELKFDWPRTTNKVKRWLHIRTTPPNHLPFTEILKIKLLKMSKTRWQL